VRRLRTILEGSRHGKVVEGRRNEDVLMAVMPGADGSPGTPSPRAGAAIAVGLGETGDVGVPQRGSVLRAFQAGEDVEERVCRSRMDR
jgi:hypothetical protein